MLCRDVTVVVGAVCPNSQQVDVDDDDMQARSRQDGEIFRLSPGGWLLSPECRALLFEGLLGLAEEIKYLHLNFTPRLIMLVFVSGLVRLGTIISLFLVVRDKDFLCKQ